MSIERRRSSAFSIRRRLLVMVAVCVLLPAVPGAQALAGTLIGTVKDAQGGGVAGALVRIESPALIGGPATRSTNQKGQLRFPRCLPDRTCWTSRPRDLRRITKKTSASAQAPRSREPLT